LCPLRNSGSHESMRKLVLVLAAAACGATESPLGPGSSSCTATLTGAQNVSNIACFASAGLDSNGDGNGAVAFTFTQPSGFQVTAGIQTIGAPTTRTYANTDTNATGACELTQTGTSATWAAVAGSSGTGNQGTYSMNVTGLGNEVTNPDGGAGEVFLSVHGTLNCTMPAFAVTGATGNFTLTATF
jgi:hypothetical protein